MSTSGKTGISRRGVSAEMEAEESRKSRLLLEARLLSETTQDEAAARFAEAAQIEERLGEMCERMGLHAKSLLHGFSAASCWAQAGNFYRAIGLCEALQARDDLPDRLRRRISEYAGRLRARRLEWYSSLGLEATGTEA